MPKVSVIIPVFNTERFLEKCLESVVNQTLYDIEIICINDCSKDNSLKVLRNYSLKDKRIKVINFTQNQGAAAARNIGIQEAEGEYLGFIDSDDYIDLDFYEKLYNTAKKTGSDIIKGSDMLIHQLDGKIIPDKHNEKIKQNKLNFWAGYTTAIYKTNFIKENNITFPEGLLVGEDPVFAIKAAFLANKIEVINNAQYHYIRHESSLNSQIWNRKKVLSYIKYIETVVDFALKQNLTDEDRRLFFGNILNDIYWTKKDKSNYNREYYNLFTELFHRVQSKSIKFPIQLLFDATILTSAENNLNNKRGIYWVAYNLLKKFVEDSRFNVTLWVEKNYPMDELKNNPLFKNLKIEISKFRLGEGGNYKLIENKKFNPLIYDVYINPAHGSQLALGGRPVIFNFLHDVIPLLRQEWFIREERNYFWRFYDNLTRETYFFCNSESCKEGFLRFFDKMDRNKMCVSYISSSQDFYPIKDKQVLNRVLDKYNIQNGARKNYMFYMGAVDDRRKNLITVIKCFIKFIRKYNIKDLYFYLGGAGKEKLEENLKLYLEELYEEYKSYIIPLGFIEDEDVNCLYSNSMFFTYLSHYEGFGMPPLEGMMAGTPVICANNSSLPEVVGDAALLVNSENEEEIINAFKEFYFNKELREEYIQRGIKRSKEFSWDKTHRIISDKILEVLAPQRMPEGIK